jgi:hypothetical protein
MNARSRWGAAALFLTAALALVPANAGGLVKTPAPANAGGLVKTPAPAAPQYTADEVAQREAWEKFLATADIVKSEPIGEGVTHPWKLYLKAGDVEKKAAWKNPTGLQHWKYEIAAYRLDKLLGLNMLPPAVEREFNGKRGALLLWVDSKTSLLKLVEDNEKARKEGRKEEPPPEFEEIVGRGKYITRIWDCLVANEDRTQENILYSADWRTLLIDHSFAFRSSAEYTDQLVYGRNGLKKYENGDPILIKQAPRELVDRIRALDFETVKKAVGSTLTTKEINSVLGRKKILVAEIEEMAKLIGESKFYF